MSRVLAALLIVVQAGAVWPVSAKMEPPAKPEDFRCLLDGKKVEGRNFFIFHRSKRKLRQAVRMTRKARIPERGYPVGTILQLFPFEAMIKRRPGFNPEGRDWEFVRLSVTPDGRTVVLESGKGEVGGFAGSCQGCHQHLAPDHDLVCEFVIGASGLGLTDEQVAAIQARDPRCQTSPATTP